MPRLTLSEKVVDFCVHCWCNSGFKEEDETPHPCYTDDTYTCDFCGKELDEDDE